MPDDILCNTLLKSLKVPLISSSAKNDRLEDHFSDPDAIIKEFGKQVDIFAMPEEYNFVGESTIVDLTEDDNFSIIRPGAGIDEVENII